MRWLGFLNSDVHKAFKPIFTPQRFLKDATMAPVLADNARGHVREYLERLDGQLEGRDWLTGERSIADPYLFVLSRWSAAKMVDMRGLDNLTRFVRMMDGDDGVQAALDAERGMPQ
jgi:glutathione S-transferase